MNQPAVPMAPAWIPPAGTLSTVPAGTYWDAVVVPQHIGLAAVEHLDQETGRRPGPIVWDPSARSPRLYFLIPAGVCGTEWRHERILTTGSYVTLPGPTTLTPPGPHWLVPPDPDNPGRLVDANRLRRALDRIRTDSTVEYRPVDGRPRRMLITSGQLNGRECIVCGNEPVDATPAGQVLTPPDGPSQLPWPVVACAAHGLAGEGA